MGKMRLFRHETVSLSTFRVLFVIKIIAGIALFLIYTRYYPDRKYADIFRYYDDSGVIYQALLSHPIDFFRMVTGIGSDSPHLQPYYDAMLNWYNTDLVFNDSRTMIRLNAVMRLFDAGTYFPHTVIMSFLAMMGLTGIYNVFTSAYRNREFMMMVIVFLMPSTLLWSSGMIKEAFLLFAIGGLLFTMQCLMEDKRFSKRKLIWIIGYIFCLLTIKAYIFFAILPGVIAWMLMKKIKRYRLLTTSAIHIIYFAALGFFAPILVKGEIPVLLAAKQQEFYKVAGLEQAKSVINIPQLDPSWESLITNAIPAFFTTLLRPTLLEVSSVMMAPAALENTLILILIFVCMAAIRFSQLKSLPDIFFVALFFSASLFILTGLTTPILGALVRYKVPAIPFLMLTITSLGSRKWMSYTPAFLLKFQGS